MRQAEQERQNGKAELERRNRGGRQEAELDR
jgi:hypothetical protein